jgi:hypothetical protein
MAGGPRFAREATLQQGPLGTERGAAGQFWTFTISNSKVSSFAETHDFGAADRMHVTFTRGASGAARHFPRQHAKARASQRGHGRLCADCTGMSARTGAYSENLGFCELLRAISVPPASFGGGFRPAAG